MNIDSTIEDLEAQAYFASQVTRSNDKFSLVIDVELLKPEQQSKRLSMALIGLDFVAGFLERSITWILIPNHSISSITLHRGLLEESIVELSSSVFVDSKLRGASISIKQLGSAKPNQGKLAQIFGNQIVLKASTLQVIPLESTEWLAVDSLSTDN